MGAYDKKYHVRGGTIFSDGQSKWVTMASFPSRGAADKYKEWFISENPDAEPDLVILDSKGVSPSVASPKEFCQFFVMDLRMDRNTWKFAHPGRSGRTARCINAPVPRMQTLFNNHPDSLYGLVRQERGEPARDIYHIDPDPAGLAASVVQDGRNGGWTVDYAQNMISFGQLITRHEAIFDTLLDEESDFLDDFARSVEFLMSQQGHRKPGIIPIGY